MNKQYVVALLLGVARPLNIEIEGQN